MLRLLCSTICALSFLTTIASVSASAFVSSPICSFDLECSLQAAGLTNYSADSKPAVRHVQVAAQQAQQSFAATASPTGKGDRLRFRQVTPAAPFLGRLLAQLHSLNRTVTFKDAHTGRNQYYVNPLVMFGGWYPGIQSRDGHNDV